MTPVRVPAESGRRIALAAILAGTTLLRLRLLGVPLERDEGEYGYLGQLVLRGEVPYLAAHNMKLPGVYYAYAGILATLGESPEAIRLGLLVVNLASIVLVYQLGRTLLDATAGVAAAAVFAALSLAPSMLGFTANAEHFVVLPMLAGVLLLAGGRRLVAAALLLGVAVVMKQHGGAFVLFGALLVASDERSGRGARRALLFLAVAAVPLVATCLAMYLAGAFESFWFWTVTYGRRYAVLVPAAAALRELGVEVRRVTADSGALWGLAAAGATALWWDPVARRRARFLGLFALCSLLAVVPGLRFSEHYFLLVVPAASLLAGAAVSALARAVPARTSRAVAVGLPLAAVALFLWQDRTALFELSPVAVSRAVYELNPFPEAVEIARYLKDHTGPDERIAVIGSEPEIYFYARRRAATTFIYTYPMMEAQPFARRLQEEMIAQLEQARPRYLVLVNVDTSWSRRPDSPSLIFDWAERTVNQEYEIVGLADIPPDGATVYRWDAEARGTGPASRFNVAVFRRRPS
jgi:hypothetical protein